VKNVIKKISLFLTLSFVIFIFYPQAPFTKNKNPLIKGVYPSLMLVNQRSYLYFSIDKNIYLTKCDLSIDNCSKSIDTNIKGQYPHVSKYGNDYRMLYVSTGDENLEELRLATSKDGLHFKDRGLLLSNSKKRFTWDSKYLHDPTEIIINNNFYLLYAGRNTEEPDSSSIGLAVSTTGDPGTYMKKGKVLSPNNVYFGKKGLFDPHIYHWNRKYILIYTGWDGEHQKWGYATSRDLFTYIPNKYPIMWSTLAWEGVNNIEPSCILNKRQWVCVYRGNSATNLIGKVRLHLNCINNMPSSYNPYILQFICRISDYLSN